MSKPDQSSAAMLPEGMRVKAATVNLAGKRFGRLVAVRVVGKHKSTSLLWECICDCGKIISRRSASLNKSKGVSSCGCYLIEHRKEHLSQQAPWNKGKSYAIKPAGHVYRNRKAWAFAVKRAFGAACQRCGWDEASCDVHHKITREDGGKNTVENGQVICPNCHRVEHETGRKK